MSNASKIRFAKGSWICDIDLQGGRITKLSYGNQTVLGSYNRIDGKQGNTHLCVPNFADEGGETYGLPFHGPARNCMWKLVSHDTGSIRCVIPKTEKYPAELSVIQRFVLSNTQFSHTITVSHIGGEPVPINIGIHNYWDTPNGWENLKLNSQDAVYIVKKNGRVPLKKENSLEFSSGKKIYWEVSGFSEAVLWSAFRGNEFDKNYVCIEPVLGYKNYFESKESILRKGEKKQYSQQISFMS